MSVYEKIASAMRNRNIDEYVSLLHDDFKFISHQDGSTKDKQAFADMVGGLMSNDSLAIQNQRCIYENDDIVVSHSVMDFPDGTREAVMVVHKLKNGKIIESETGATPISN
ncbi:MAG: nuclear transport factor 2 family protein [Gammaproteobacteria bacterium]|nr:nuclear transport factor 2 family protein [Gammaproteobacteria bacterium]MDH3534362.1 nuclear transport factor 2 family protein [Gammaproteobacteria bacterium]